MRVLASVLEGFPYRGVCVVWVVPMDQMVRVVRVVQRTWTTRTWTNGRVAGPGRPPSHTARRAPHNLPQPIYIGLIRLPALAKRVTSCVTGIRSQV
jgi:hypothetical protein